MNHPSAEQRVLLDSLVSAAGPHATVLEAQFAACRSWTDETCPECFYLRPSQGSPALPKGCENPMSFSASIAADPLGATVYLWHTGGRVDWVEISWDGDQHPTLGQLRVESEPYFPASR